MANISAIDLRSGNIIRYKNALYKVVDTEHVKPGKGGAFIQVELKSVKGNTKLNERLRSEEKVEKLNSEARQCQFLYSTGDALEFMDLESFEQFTISSDMLGAGIKFLSENMRNDKIIVLSAVK
jgi:elongation factor P